MKRCSECNGRIPLSLILNGKKHRTSNKRKFCFDCSPFGTNTPPFKVVNTNRTVIIKCRRCRTKILECSRCTKTYIYTRQGYHNSKLCSPCHITLYRQYLKVKAVEYKGGKCQLCGYSKCIAALEFHHRDPNQKEFSLSKVIRSFEKMKKELDKCDLLCSNCHREVEYQQQIQKYSGQTGNQVRPIELLK